MTPFACSPILGRGKSCFDWVDGANTAWVCDRVLGQMFDLCDARLIQIHAYSDQPHKESYRVQQAWDMTQYTPWVRVYGYEEGWLFEMHNIAARAITRGGQINCWIEVEVVE